MHVSEHVREEDGEYAYQLVKKICTEVGPGCPCTPQERARAMIVKNELETIVDTVDMEEFTCSPGSFFGWFRVGVVLAVVSAIFYALSFTPTNPVFFASLAFGIGLFIFLMMIYEFFMYKEFIDVLFRKKRSQNVVGRIKCQGEPKRIIIFSGHHDSAPEFTWLRHLKFGYYIAEGFLIYGVIGLLANSSINLASILWSFSTPEWVTIHFYILFYLVLPPSFIFGMFFVGSSNNGGKVPGAVDNLSAVACALAVGRILKNHRDLIPPDTEVRLISFGSEEAGTRGSANYVRSHLAELKEKDVRCLNIETISEPRITIFKSDLNAALRTSPELVKQVVQAAESAHVPHRVKPFPFGGGGTDAIPFTRMGIKCVSVYSLKAPAQMIAFYHQRTDNYDKLNKEALQNVMKIALELVRVNK